MIWLRRVKLDVLFAECLQKSGNLLFVVKNPALLRLFDSVRLRSGLRSLLFRVIRGSRLPVNLCLKRRGACKAQTVI